MAALLDVVLGMGAFAGTLAVAYAFDQSLKRSLHGDDRESAGAAPTLGEEHFPWTGYISESQSDFSR